ncbi:MAG: LytR C-terminal domain-containing protein [Solirubrobacterales bacterium]
MHVIEQIGAFAGLAAFFGLGVLALLSFSQARDIRRLREWAGSAPERDAERKESTSEAAAERAEELRRLEEGRTAEREAAELRETRRQRREAGLPELTRSERMRLSLSGGHSRLAEPIFLVAVFLAVVVIGGGVAYAVLGGSGGGGNGSHGIAKPAEIEVTVLNGTAVPGLAASYSNKVKRKGFSLGAVTNSSSSYTNSVVMFSRGHAPEGHRVAKALGISQVRLETPDIASVAAGAPVSVIVGEENASSSP